MSKFTFYSIALLLGGVASYAQNNFPDPSFGTTGVVHNHMSTYSRDQYFAITKLVDGKILSVGSSENGYTSSMILYKIMPNPILPQSVPDNSFGINGKVSFLNDIGYNRVAKAVKEQPDGKILVGADDGGNLIVIRLLANGNVDTTFGTNGFCIVNLPSQGTIKGMELLADGKIVIAGTSMVSSLNNIIVAKITSSGILDNTFGSNGTVTTPIGNGHTTASAMKIQLDNKILVCGTTSNGIDKDYVLLRYNSDGVLDPSFDLDGYVTNAMGSLNDEALAMDIQTDGKIIVSGKQFTDSQDFGVGVVRYTTSGLLDPTFGTNGKLEIFPASYITTKGVISTSGGDIYIGGSTPYPLTGYGGIVLKVTPAGVLSTTYGPGGQGFTELLNSTSVKALCATPSEILVVGEQNYKISLTSITYSGTNEQQYVGSPIAVGPSRGMNISRLATASYMASGYTYSPSYNNIIFAASKYQQSGALDTSYGSSINPGKFLGLNLTEAELHHGFQANGKMIMAGGNRVHRVNTDGTSDYTFAGSNAIYGTSHALEIHKVAIKNNDQILLFGHTDLNGGMSLAIVKLLATGYYDTTFGVNGYAELNIPNSPSEFLNDFAIQPDNKILAAGFYTGSTGYSFPCVVRYLENGVLDPSFGNAGVVLMDTQGFTENLLLTNTGQIILVGIAPSFIAKFNSDGTPDNSFGVNGVVSSNDFNFQTGCLSNSNKIIVAGEKLAQYDSSGNLDTNFGTNGTITIDPSLNISTIEDIEVQPDNKIIAIGDDTEFYLLRFLPDANLGTIDFSGTDGAMYIYPNPVETQTTFTYTLVKDAFISIEIFDLNGRVVSTIKKNELQRTGEYNLPIGFPNQIAKGTYILKISSHEGTNSIKLFKK